MPSQSDQRGKGKNDKGKEKDGKGKSKEKTDKGGKGQSKGRPTTEIATTHMSQLFSLSPEEQASCSQCIVYQYTMDDRAPTMQYQPNHGTVFATIELDTFEAAEHLQHQGWPAVSALNLANEYNCGGAWSTGNGSQEEDLFRCSSLPLCLWPRRRKGDARSPEFDDRLPVCKPIFPLSPACVIFSPHVRVCRWRDGTARPDDQQFVCSVLSSAAQDLKRVEYDRALMIEKLRSVLWAAVSHGCESLVLGAYGCGAFKHDPKDIAKMFQKLLCSGGEFEGLFKIVAFAIIKSQDNFTEFSKIFPCSDRKRVARCPAHLSKSCADGGGASSSLSAEEKEALSLRKKIREVVQLEDKDNLQPAQIAKVAKKDDMLRQLVDVVRALPATSNVFAQVQEQLAMLPEGMQLIEERKLATVTCLTADDSEQRFPIAGTQPACTEEDDGGYDQSFDTSVSCLAQGTGGGDYGKDGGKGGYSKNSDDKGGYAAYSPSGGKAYAKDGGGKRNGGYKDGGKQACRQ